MSYAENSIGYDCTFELNEFGKPKISSEIETLKNALLFILYSKPGQYPSIPFIGLDFENILYSFYDEIDEDDIKTRIIEQCSLLGLYFSNTTIQIKKIVYQDQPSLLINLKGTEQYPDDYMTNKNGNPIQYLIGVTLDDIGKMVYNISKEGLEL
jgi:hypothetical protein